MVYCDSQYVAPRDLVVSAQKPCSGLLPVNAEFLHAETQGRGLERLTNLMAIFCIIAWRVFWLCMINRISPDSTAKTVFTETEMRLLDHLISVKNKSQKKTIKTYLTLLAKLGGYLDRSHDPPPGNMVVWRGFRRLTDIHLGFSLAQKFVGN